MGLLDHILDMLANRFVGVDADEALAETAHEADDALPVDNDRTLVRVVNERVNEFVSQLLEFVDLSFFCHAIVPG